MRISWTCIEFGQQCPPLGVFQLLGQGSPLSVPIPRLPWTFEPSFPQEGPGPHPSGAACTFERTQTHCADPLYSAQLSCLGVDEDSLYQTANSQRLEHKQWKAWIAHRAFVALYVTSHRGHSDAVQYLLEHGNFERWLSMFTSWGLPRVGRAECLSSRAFRNGVLDPSCVNHQSWSHGPLGSLFL